jgi:hypothetical protein
VIAGLVCGGGGFADSTMIPRSSVCRMSDLRCYRVILDVEVYRRGVANGDAG